MGEREELILGEKEPGRKGSDGSAGDFSAFFAIAFSPFPLSPKFSSPLSPLLPAATLIG
jgi:hypothetical protein